MDKAALGQAFSEYSVSPANHHSTKFLIIIIIRGWHNRPIGGRSAEWTQLDSTPNYTNLIFKLGYKSTKHCAEGYKCLYFGQY
jgi:hypothetical protein